MSPGQSIIAERQHLQRRIEELEGGIKSLATRLEEKACQLNTENARQPAGGGLYDLGVADTMAEAAEMVFGLLYEPEGFMTPLTDTNDTTTEEP